MNDTLTQPGDLADSGFNHHRPFKTRCGWSARLVGELQRTAYPLVVAIMNPQFNAEEVRCYGIDGKAEFVFSPDPIDPSGEPSIEMAQQEARLHPFTLVNTDYTEWADSGVEHVDSFTRDLPSLPKGEAPWHHENMLMYTVLVRDWVAMHSGYDNVESPRALGYVVLCNVRSGQRIHVDLRSKSATKVEVTS